MISPRYDHDGVTLYCGDCLEILPQLEAGSVDAVITDPPYFEEVNDKWDHQWVGKDSYLHWVSNLIKEYKRIMKPGGALFCFTSAMMAAHIEMIISDYLNIVNNIVWVKSGDSVFARRYGINRLRKYAQKSERIIFAENMALPVAIRAARYRFHLSTKELTEMIGAYGNTNHGGTVSNLESGKNVPSRQQYEKLSEILGLPPYEFMIRPFNANNETLTDVWEYPTPSAISRNHPCEKPLEMITQIIKTNSRLGDTILDPFMGSGTTGVACVQTGRKFIGIEIDPGYYEIAEKRIRDAQRQIRMPI